MKVFSQVGNTSLIKKKEKRKRKKEKKVVGIKCCMKAKHGCETEIFHGHVLIPPLRD